jgi:hypothetical protein
VKTQVVIATPWGPQSIDVEWPNEIPTPYGQAKIASHHNIVTFLRLEMGDLDWAPEQRALWGMKL